MYDCHNIIIIILQKGQNVIKMTVLTINGHNFHILCKWPEENKKVLNSESKTACFVICMNNYCITFLFKFIFYPAYMLWFKFTSSSNFFKLVHILQTGSYFLNQFIFFKLVHISKLSRFVRGTFWFDSIRTLRLNSIRTELRLANWLPAWRINNIFNPSSKSRSTIFCKCRINRLLACRIDRRGNDSCQFDGIRFMNRFPVCRIANTKDESTLVGCIGQPSLRDSVTLVM